MTRIQFLGAAAVSWLLLTGAISNDALSASAQDCGLPVSREVPPPTIAGPANFTKRVDFIPQPDAPIRIVGIDFSRASLSTSGKLKAKYSLVVENVTNEVVTSVHPMVQLLRYGRAVSNAAGPIARRPLAPGERLRIDDDTVFGPLDDDTRIQVSISIVGFGMCTWKDQRWGEAWSGRTPLDNRKSRQ
jgi:hypothetical protein